MDADSYRNEFGEVCLVGSLVAARGGLLNGSTIDAWQVVANLTELCLTAEVNSVDGEPADLMSLTDIRHVQTVENWNDESTRTADDAFEVLQLAEKRMREHA